ncbi:hypothetical protein Tco_1315518 [Tanacetum coccineum]
MIRKSKAREEFDSNIPDSSHQTVMSTPPLIAPFTNVTSSEPSLLVTPPPINTEATTITTSIPEITPFIALQLRVAKLEQYVLERHTADLIEKYSVLPGPESVKNQESEKTPKEIIKAKKEQDEEKQDSTYSIRSTDKVDLEEFDLKTLIADEDAMDKEVADQVKDHKRKHDSDDDEDDDDDEGPSAGSNQGRRTGKKEAQPHHKADLEGPHITLVKAFQTRTWWFFLQYIWMKGHKLLSNKSIGESEVDKERKNLRGPMHHSLGLGGRNLYSSNTHSEASSDREAVRSHMRILSVVSVKVFEKYGYNYLREIILRRADYQEYKISEKDFKNLHPNDFEDLFLLNIQEKPNHLPKTDKD